MLRNSCSCRAVGAELRGERPDGTSQDLRRLLGVDRKLVVEVLQRQLAVGEIELQLAALEHAPVLIAKDRQQQLVVQRGLDRRPVDVEERRARGTRTVLEDVTPPQVRRRADAHVIGNEVDHVPEAERLEPSHESRVSLGAAELGVDRVVVGDVVAVRAAGARREVRRGVARADAELRQILDELRGGVEREASMQLETIGAQRSVHGCN